MGKAAEQNADRTHVISRVFDAPRDLVWRMWTDCKHLKHWWGPKGWSLPVCKLDFRVGGIWHYCMEGPMPDGSVVESWGRATYREIVEPERIIYQETFSDEVGTINEAMAQMMITLTFADVDGKTEVTNHTLFESADQLQAIIDMGMEQGLAETWDRLEEYVKQIQ